MVNPRVIKRASRQRSCLAIIGLEQNRAGVATCTPPNASDEHGHSPGFGPVILKTGMNNGVAERLEVNPRVINIASRVVILTKQNHASVATCTPPNTQANDAKRP